jgi:GR25 family glycosyltransferase involved in LPS biosynthesis
MNIYLINSINEECKQKLCQFNLIDLTNINREKVLSTLNIDFLYRENKFGIKLSEFELSLYLKHYIAWKHFKETEDAYCLIVENIDNVIQKGECILNIINEFPNDCDIFFPYDGSKRAIKNYQITYTMGYRWGMDAYFLNQNASKILLKTNTIKQTVEDEIFGLGGKDKLNIYYEDTGLFNYGSDMIYKTDRNKTILKTISELKLWDENDKKKVRRLIKPIFGLALDAGIELFISHGTLLAYIRHGKIMGWDDDIDISLNIKDLDIFLKAVEKKPALNICKWYWGTDGALYYKIWDDSGVGIPQRSYKFPFIDIWLYKKESNALIYNYGTKYSLATIFPLQSVVFEQSLINIPFDPLNYLDTKYKDWRNTIKVFPLRHKTERNELIPLAAKIKTNSDGRIINEFEHGPC